MAITKLPRSGIADNSINASKIEDGTIAIAEVSGTISNAKIKDGEIANAKLSNSAITIRGTSRALGTSVTIGVDVDWQSKITSDGSTVTTLVAQRGYFVDNSSAAGIVKLPTSASAGDTIKIKDYAGNFGTNVLVIQRNGHNIQGVANDGQIQTNRASLTLVYVDSTKGWLYVDEHNVSDLRQALHTAATGGTVTTSGDFKIHTFTGDGNFVVSQVGNAPVTGAGPSSADYMVVAGGGAGAGSGGIGGGGGAGGYRSSGFGPSPLRGTAITLTATTFPVTVGGGAAAYHPAYSPGSFDSNASGKGSNSVFSTITSTGGGGGGVGGAPDSPGATSRGGTGGSGGGGNGGWGTSGGAGNTPSTSPAQGNAGGNANPGSSPPTRYAGGGGGGAGATGNNGSGTPRVGGAGGAGVPNTITGSDVTYAGGGGAGGSQGGGSGGAGGGGAGNPCGPPSGSQTAGVNTGSGGGGGGNNVAGAGGKGIVVIRYKFQN